MKKVLEIGGFIAGAVLTVFGIAAIVLAINGNSTVSSSLKQEKITGTPDMTPAAIKKEAAGQPWATGYTFPTNSVAGKTIDSGSTARTFAQYMRASTLEATGGLTYAQMGRYATANGSPAGTNDTTKAVMKNGQPVANSARDIWVTETALTTALNVSYMASQLALFSIVVGVALLLAGIGFIVLDYAALHRRRAVTEAVESAPPLKATRPAMVYPPGSRERWGAERSAPHGVVYGQLLVAYTGISVAAASTAGEEEAGILALTLARPVERTSLVLAKSAAVAISVALVALVPGSSLASPSQAGASPL